MKLRLHYFVLVMMGAWLSHAQSLDSFPEEWCNYFGFSDTSNCASASCYKDIAIGTPLVKIQGITDTPLPKGLFWPEYLQPDGSIFSGIVVDPPLEWGTNYVSWLDGASEQKYWFYHDNTNIVRIVFVHLLVTSTPPREAIREVMELRGQARMPVK